MISDLYTGKDLSAAHLALGILSGSLPVLSIPIGGLFFAHQLIDSSQGEPLHITIKDVSEYGAGYFLGHILKQALLKQGLKHGL